MTLTLPSFMAQSPIGQSTRQDDMASDPVSRGMTIAPVDPWALRLIKRFMLVLIGPVYFLCLAFVPLFCAGRRGFRGWYWRLVKRACSRLLWLLSIRADMSESDRKALAEDSNSIIVMNHRSHLDGFLLMDVVPDQKWFTFAAKKELCDSRLLSTGFAGAGLVEIDRSSGKVALATLSRAVRRMPVRRSVMLFPEGTRTTGTSLGEFKAGAVLVARETGRSIRPIVIHDSDRLLPRGAKMPASGTVRISVLPPFNCDPSGPVDDDVKRLRAAMMAVFCKG